MKNFKLYTEEQVRQMLFRIGDFIYSDYAHDAVLSEHKPIELPSKNDLKKIVDEIVKSKNDFDEKIAISSGATLGYLWVIEQIKQQADGK